MRKITLLFASLFLCAGAWAQTAETRMTADQLNAVTEKQAIAIECTQESSYNTYYNGAGRTNKVSQDIVFYWVPVEEGVPGAYYIMKGDGESDYLQNSNITTFGTKDAAAKFHAVKPYAEGTADVAKFDGAHCHYASDEDKAAWVRLAFTDDSKWFNFRVDGYDTGTGVWTVQLVYDMSNVDLTEYTITYNFKYNGVVIYTQTTTALKGTAYPAINTVLPYGVTCTTAAPEGTVEEDKTVDIELTITTPLPVEAATTVEGITTWYYVKMHSNTPKYIQALEDGTIEWADTEATAGDGSYLWGFVGDVWGMKMVSKGGKAIVSTSGDALLGDAANATSFVVTASAATQDGFCLQYADKSYLNAQNGFVKSWTANDAGSTLLLEKYDPEATGIEAITTNAETVIYDLSGRRVEKMEKGIYIVNGKKIIK